MIRWSLMASLVLGCGAPATSDRAASADRGAGAEVGESPAEAPLSPIPECDRYLRLYRTCEPALASAIAAGDRRDFVHERAWLDSLAGTPEGAGLAAACGEMTRELQAVCP